MSFLNEQLSKNTSIFSLKLWVILAIFICSLILVILLILYFYYVIKRKITLKRINNNIPVISKEITEILVELENPARDVIKPVPGRVNKLDSDSEKKLVVIASELVDEKIGGGGGAQRVHIEIGAKWEVGWGNWYSLREIEECTNGFDDGNVIGEGGYGIVYHGVLEDHTHVAVKSLLNNRGQAEKEFKVEVEAIGRVRHKNLVRLLGYCAEGAHRILVYEYVDNGNIEQWLHGDVGPLSPITWDARINILVGTAKGLTYLHEGLEPKVVHRDIKSSNILVDKQWNPKVSDFGLAKLLGSDLNYVTTRVMGTFGYVAPEYASSGMLNERSDVYSFGILVMEIISGRNPVDYSRPPGEVKLVDWVKQMVSTRNTEGIIDPKLAEKPSSRALKRVLLVALRCVDPNAQKRPKMGQVVHMLEAEEFPFREDRRVSREHAQSDHSSVKERRTERRAFESGDSSGYDSGAPGSRPPLPKP
ncbi:putative serine/threonine-protein kinase At1g01540 [Silene latifolia]|uniref:putative serine/threonine-protein kinase At1g01540 n=1 Tax=Silene latifolia TaxID=37657 RepID=UPI003D77274C